MHVLVTYTTLLWDATGPGAAFVPACPTVNLMHVSGLLSLCFFVTNVTFAFIAFDAYRQLHRTRGKALLAGVVVAHWAQSASTVLNNEGGSCAAAVLLTLLVTLGSVAAAFRILQQTYVLRIR